MWSSHIDVLKAGRVRKVLILRNSKRLSYAEVVRQWQHDEAFRTFFVGLLAEVPFPAYLWETPPVTATTLDRGFECVMVDSAQLASAYPDPHAFAEHFDAADVDDDIVTFPNLGQDAVLVAPCPRAPVTAYPHLAAFARRAPESQQHALWRRVGAALERRLGREPVWLSTSGLGIYWLHVRLDSWPKYYSFRAYRNPD